MTSNEQRVKNRAIIFAIAVAAVIIGLICFFAYNIAALFTGNSKKAENGDIFYKEYDASGLKSIVIDCSAGQLTICSGDKFEVLVSDIFKNFSCEYEENTLTIKNTYNKTIDISTYSDSKITVTVPKNITLESLLLETGACTLSISDISAKKFNLNTGAGSGTVTGLTSDSVRIETGAGSMKFTQSALNDMSLQCGIGTFIITDSTLSGNSKIKCGIGDFTLNLNGNSEDYEVSISSSLGHTTFNGKSYSGNSTINKGAANVIEVEGGIGNVSITIK